MRRMDPRERLSRRKTEVLELASFGLTNGHIAAKSSITTYAVKFHLSGSASLLRPSLRETAR